MGVWVGAASNPTYFSTGDTGDQYGYSVSVSADGSVVAVGCPYEDSSDVDAGGVYIYDRPAGAGGALVQRGSMIPPPVVVGFAWFGMSVALSGNGLVLAVGTRSDSEFPRIWTYDWSGSAWVKRTYLYEHVGASDIRCLTLNGDGTIMAWGRDDANTVHVFDWSGGVGGSWVARGTLTPGGTTTYISAVSLSSSGTTIAVGKQYEYASGGGSYGTGAVFTYEWSGSAWVAFGGAQYNAVDASASENFGRGVGLNPAGNVLVVGCPLKDVSGFADTGRVYTFTKGATSWVANAPVTFSQATVANLYLGSSIGLGGTGDYVLVVGAPGYNRTGSLANHGAVYVYDMSNPIQEYTDTFNATAVASLGALGSSLTSTANITDVAVAFAEVFIAELVRYDVSLAAGANTTATFADSAVIRDTIQQAINQIVADAANGTDAVNLGAALTLVDIANAVQTQTSTYNSVMLVAELIATLEAYNGADGYDITESGGLSETYVARVEALAAMIEAAQAVDTNTALVHVMQTAADSADGVTTITSAGSLLNALLNDAVLATIRLNIGGELFTGWVLNADTLAPSEYQFADLQFNSACKHGDTYLLAADDGIYQFTEETGVETVMTYIKTGKTDFGSDLKKRVVNSYMVYSASGQMVLKVTTSEFGNLVTRNYRMTPQADDTTDTRRIDIGKGIKSRYWQFEVVGEGVDCDIDEIGMLPIVLSRRL